MTTNPTDPNQVRLTGENSFIRLAQEEGGPSSTRVSHWRILLSPAGPGHVLYIKSDLHDDEVRIYSDNIGLARWLQGEIESMLFPEFADEDTPVIAAEFIKSGDGRSYWTETVESSEELIELTWYDFGEPFMLVSPRQQHPGQGPRRLQLLCTRPQSADNLQWRRGRRQRVPGDAGRQSQQHRLPGLVGDLGETLRRLI